MEEQKGMSREAVGMLAKLFITLLLLLIFVKGCSNFIFQNAVDSVLFNGKYFEENGENLKALNEYRRVVAWDHKFFFEYERVEEAAYKIAEILEKKLYKYGEAREAYMNFCEDYSESDLRAKAEKGIERSRASGDEYVALWQKADKHLKAGRFSRAEVIYRRISEMAPLDITAQLKVKESQALAEARMTKAQAISMVSMHLRTSGRDKHRVRFTSYWVKNSQSYRDSLLIDIPVTRGEEAAAVWDCVRACLQLLKHRFTFDLGKVVIRENSGGVLNPPGYEAYEAMLVHDVEVAALRAYNGGWKTRDEILNELKVTRHRESH